MATRYIIPVTVVLLFLFTITLSRARDLQNQLPESNSETTTRSKPQQYDTVSFNLNSVDHVPLTFLDFRPINCHIRPQQQRPLPLDFPLSHHRCRHSHRHQILSNDANTKDHYPQVFYPQVMPYHYHDHDHAHDHHHNHHHHEKGWFAEKIDELMNLF
jgi:hypothetical protein